MRPVGRAPSTNVRRIIQRVEFISFVISVVYADPPNCFSSTFSFFLLFSTLNYSRRFAAGMRAFGKNKRRNSE